MAEMGVLEVNMLGGFSMSYGDRAIGDNGGHSSKIWNLLAYLITYKHREVPQGELIDLLWSDDEDIQNPLGALKTLMHRTRAELDELGLDGKKLILSRRGSYYWNCEAVKLDVDTDCFEQLCQRAEKVQYGKSALPDMLKAAEMYGGDFLPNLSSFLWVTPLSVYYNSKFITIVYAALDQLFAQERYEDVITLCRRAAAIAPYDEPLNAQMIEALVKLGRYQLALSHYHQVTDMLYQQFAVSPSEEFCALYKEIVKQTSLEEACISDVNERIRGNLLERGAYFCQPPIFEEICRYDARTKLRTGGIAFLGLLTLRGENDTALDNQTLNKAMKDMHATIRDSLRCGDCFSQISVSQFAILLQNTTYEKGLMVMMRLVRVFRRKNADNKVIITQSLEQLDPLKLADA